MSAAPAPTIAAETERLILRDWTGADVAPFVRHTNRPEVMRWLGGVMPPGELEAMVRGRYMAWQAERGFTFWVAQRKADGALLGFCGIKVSDGEDSPVAGWHEIGWRLRADAWGQGYAREAATAALDRAFGPIGAPRVVALTVKENVASWGLMERLGMERRADLDHHDRRPGRLNPVIVYCMEKERWTALRS